MAVANAIGSNIFDILIGLGLPWLIGILFIGGMSTIHVGVDDLWTSTIVLLSTVVLLFVFLTTGRVLSRKEGWVLVASYVAFAAWILIGEAQY